MISPWEVCSPSACTSVMKASSAARFWPPRTMPNSDACLIELTVSAPHGSAMKVGAVEDP
jgi:hypothetical protein